MPEKKKPSGNPEFLKLSKEADGTVLEELKGDLSNVGALRFILAPVEQLFKVRSKKKPIDIDVPLEVDRAFLDSDAVRAAADCTDNFDADRLISIFDAKFVK